MWYFLLREPSLEMVSIKLRILSSYRITHYNTIPGSGSDTEMEAVFPSQRKVPSTPIRSTDEIIHLPDPVVPPQVASVPSTSLLNFSKNLLVELTCLNWPTRVQKDSWRLFHTLSNCVQSKNSLRLLHPELRDLLRIIWSSLTSVEVLLFY